MFSNLFKQSINPDYEYRQLLLNPMMYVSIIVHTILYSCVLYLILKPKRMNRIVLSLVVLMFCGYFLRLMRSKQLMSVYNDKNKVKELMHQGYFCWYFLG